MGPLRSNRRRLFFIGGGGLIFLAAAAVVTGLIYLAPGPVRIPSFPEVKEAYRASDAILRDRNGVVIHEMRVDLKGRSLDWVPLVDVSPVLVTAVVRSEDRRFFAHQGVDTLAFFSAVLGNAFFREKRGASTITMQLASVIDRKLAARSGRRSWREKARQIRAAAAIEGRWSKREILEAYLNLVGFRGELRGIAAASRGLFGKEPSGLDCLESLILAVLIRSPNAPVEKVTERAAALDGTLKTGIGKADLAARLRETLLKPYALKAHVALAPHAAFYLLNENRKEARCTLDGDLQAFAAGLLRAQLGALKRENVTDGAILVVENRTGEIRAYVGNGGAQSSAFWVDGIRAKRQAGSTLKPFLYALAFDAHTLTAASLIDDSSLEIPTERGIYKPENYDHSFKGPVAARTALASSLNVPAVRALMLTGAEEFVTKLRDLGFSGLRDGEYYSFSLALGTLDVSLYELTNAYRTLANGGIRGDLTLLPRKAHGKGGRVFSRESAFIVSDILSDREARSLTFGYENPLATRFWAAAKTGTSKDMRDNWCLGYSRDYTVGVWIGNFSGSSMWNVSGVSGAAPLWHEIMNYLHRSTPSRPPEVPGGVAVAAPTGGRDGTGREEWFIKGTEPQQVRTATPSRARTKILYPPGNLVIALDPDIPLPRQKVFFEATAPARKVAWMVDNEVIGRGDLCPWSPTAGTHTLKLVDEAMTVLDEVSFTVRD